MTQPIQMIQSIGEQFAAWVHSVAAETPDRKIKHSMWEDCAVGEFCTATGNDIETTPNDIYDDLGNEVYETLNNGGRGGYGRTIDISTYGKLSQFLKLVASESEESD